MLDRQVLRKLRPVEILAVAFICLFILAIVTGGSSKSRHDARRTECARNLSMIGNAMRIYANDYDGAFPRSGGRNSQWMPIIPNWQAASKFGAHCVAATGDGGVGTISSCFYLLVKYTNLPLESFVCPSDTGVTVFIPADEGSGDRELFDLWDFGALPSSHCSYSYQMPFGLYNLTTSSEPTMAVAADRNPWCGSSRREEIRMLAPEGGREAAKIGNSITHENEGQNVLFLDGHVAFEKDAFCGVNDDNIYTFWDGGDIRRGAIPFIGAEPADGRDSLLVNEPPIRRTEVVKDIISVDSNDLKQTSVVATLDCPIPKRKNVVWCAPFQMAWEKFKDDIIGEPIQLRDAPKLADRLNQNQYSPENIEAESFYAAAGFVEDGILEEIQGEMARRFPAEPKVVFDPLYRTLDKASIAYAFLSLDVGFKYPFYVNNNKFAFENSNGTRTNVISFRADTEFWNSGSESVRDQVEILYHKHKRRAHPRTAEFAIDLCRHTQPYQIVLARVPCGATLGKTLATVQGKISEYEKSPNREDRRQLDFMDELIVPDILYKLTHEYAELKRALTNPQWRERGYFIFEAKQVLKFSLSRKGVSLKSEARLGGAGALPRRLHFNRPFLIYVKKRGAEYSPFFVMWVDNAELMQEF